MNAVIPVDDVGRSQLTDPPIERRERVEAELAVLRGANDLGLALEIARHQRLIAHANRVSEEKDFGESWHGFAPVGWGRGLAVGTPSP